ncbi:MAG: PQQ-binding-like beta-propeller repeat protein [Betaproteobacteria bacterium]
MATRQTTICCSAVALATVAALSLAADRPEGLPLFPLETVWTLPLNNPATAPAAYDGNRAYYPIADDRTVAYDLELGTRLWIAPVGTRMEPAAGGGLVFLARPGSMAALSGETGSILWELPLPGALSVPPVWDTGWLVLATASGRILALRASDGQAIWQRDLGSPAHAPPALSGHRVFVPTEDGRLVALSIDDGHPLWDRRLGGAASDILALDDRLYVGSKDNFFYCLETKDGAEDWRWRTGADVIGLPVVDERAVYFVSLDNVLRALSRKSGVQYWKATLPLRPTSGPIRAGDALLVTGLAESLLGYKMKDGKSAGNVALAGELAGHPYVLDRPGAAGPLILLPTRDIASGETVTALTHSLEPPIMPLATLPDVETVTMPSAPSRPSS